MTIPMQMVLLIALLLVNDLVHLPNIVKRFCESMD